MCRESFFRAQTKSDTDPTQRCSCLGFVSTANTSDRVITFEFARHNGIIRHTETRGRCSIGVRDSN